MSKISGGDALISSLEREGVEVIFGLPGVQMYGVVDALRELQIKKLVVGTPYLDEINTKEAEFLYEKGIILPTYTKLKNKKIDFICDLINET